MEEIMRQLATNAADYAVGKYGMSLPKGRQLRLWQRYYDSAYASIIAFEELHRARRIRQQAMVSEN